MTETTKNLRTRISEINPRDLMYAGIILLFFGIVIVLFSLSTQFISKNINNAFLGDTTNKSGTLNIPNYTLVAKKLGIDVTVQLNQNETSATEAATTPSVENGTLATTTTQTIDKSSLTLNILNSTAKRGVAGALAQALEAAGYTKASTGNESGTYRTTTILIKESRANFGPALIEEVKKLYPNTSATTTPETASFDVTIIIGGK